MLRRKNEGSILIMSLMTFSIVSLICITCSALILSNNRISDLEYKNYLLPLIYVLIIGAIYILTLIFCAQFLKKQMPKIRPMIHMSAFNCAVLGALLLSTNEMRSAAGMIGFGLGSGIGFTMAAYLMSIAFDKLNSEKIPKAFRGFPIAMIYIGILSLAFYGLVGHELPF